MTDQPKHHPTLHRTGGHGCWVTCSCGWRSRTWTTIPGAHLEFGQHLATPTTPIPEAARD